ncbi:MAG: VWA domain-containing protein [Anaerolineales bacterium]|nr:VWA domain-containing protein [Anaerolineales bacterium]
MSTKSSFSRPIAYLIIAFLVTVVLASLPMTTMAKTTYDLVIHFINPVPKSGEAVYDVAVYLSVMDEDGKLEKDLGTGDLTVSEDGNELKIDSVDIVGNEPIDILLLLDNSSSMSGGPIASARDAMREFIDDMGRDDNVAIVSFNDENKTLIDFTTDHDEAQDKLDKLETEARTGNCIYDAVYNAVEMMANRPTGRRAIVVLTDGKDETFKGKSCSVHNIDDVTDLATEWGTRMPIDTIGLGDGADEKALERVATLTGGRYRKAEKHKDLTEKFNDLSNQIRNEYLLHYTSTSAPGTHTLLLAVDYRDSKDQDTRKIVLPELTGAVTAAETAVATETPAMALAVGATTVAEAIATVAPVAVTKQAEVKEEKALSSTTLLIGVAAVVVIGVIVAVLIISMLMKRGKPSGRGGVAPAGAPPPVPGSEQTVDGYVPPSPGYGAGFAGAVGGQIGVLTVLSSDDPMMVGQVITVNAGRTTIGRSAECDIVLPKDKAVSREHAGIEQMGKQVFLTELVSQQPDGSVKKPTYGTFVNEAKVGNVPVELKTGDIIRLGNRLKLRFEKFGGGDLSAEATIDGFNVAGSEATMDGSAPASDETVEYKQ